MKKEKRIGRDEFFMKNAQLCAELSVCKYFKVGVIFAKDKRNLAGGYNGPPSGEPHCIEVGCAKEDKNGKRLPAASGLCRGAHAEMNAMANANKAGVILEGSTVYCTFSPCYDCAKVLVNLGIKGFVYLEEYSDEDKNLAKELFKRHDISVRKMEI